MTFTVSRDPEGKIATEGFPDGLTATYTRDATGAVTNLAYVKASHCGTTCNWFTDSVVPSIQGQWLEQTSSFSSQAASYDAAGRLTQVQSTPTGKGCTTRIYGWDEDTNRTSLTTREPNAKGECATEGGATEKHTYDQADRLSDAGVSYDPYGDVAGLPAVDAGGPEGGSELTTEYFSDGQAQSQKQNGQTIGSSLDPAGRPLEAVLTGATTADYAEHYSGSGESPAWTSNTTGEWTRDISGPNGALVAVQSNGEAPVLQLSNLHGDIVATAYLAESATELASKADTSEFGVPSVSAPARYSWLGAIELPTELASGVMTMGVRSYVPSIGRFLQPDPIPGASANAYSYTFGDPINTVDPSGETPAAWSIETSAEQAEATAAPWIAEQAAIAAAKRAAEEAAARELAHEYAGMAEWAAMLAAGPQYASWGMEEEWEEWEEEEPEYANLDGGATSLKDAAFGQMVEGARSESRLESAIVQERSEEGETEQRDTRGSAGNCQGNRKCKRYRRTHKRGENVPEGSPCFGAAVTISLAGPFVPVGIAVGSGIGAAAAC
jgi:RHS repeat-associated protein